MPLSAEVKEHQRLAFIGAQERAIETAVAKAEIAIEVVLGRLANATKRKIKVVSVDTDNFSAPSVEIYLAE